MTEFFAERGIKNVDDYVIDVKALDHQALHAGYGKDMYVKVQQGGKEVAKKIKAGWWEVQLLKRISEREIELGKMLNKTGMEKIVRELMTDLKITGEAAEWHRYTKG